MVAFYSSEHCNTCERGVTTRPNHASNEQTLDVDYEEEVDAYLNVERTRQRPYRLPQCQTGGTWGLPTRLFIGCAANGGLEETEMAHPPRTIGLRHHRTGMSID